jgi:hypothetical protein
MGCGSNGLQVKLISHFQLLPVSMYLLSMGLHGAELNFAFYSYACNGCRQRKAQRRVRLAEALHDWIMNLMMAVWYGDRSAQTRL